MKIKETRNFDQGAAGPRKQTRVRELGAKEEMPKDAEALPDDAELHDWKNEVKSE